MRERGKLPAFSPNLATTAPSGTGKSRWRMRCCLSQYGNDRIIFGDSVISVHLRTVSSNMNADAAHK
jgi:hypothetical protein